MPEKLRKRKKACLKNRSVYVKCGSDDRAKKYEKVLEENRLTLHPVVMVCLDSLRPDYLSYMPALSKLVQRGVWFEDSHTVFPSDTCPAHMSLLTGCYPERNGYSFGFYEDPLTKKYSIGQLKPFEEHIWKTSVLGVATREGMKCISISFPGLNESRPSFLVKGDEIIDLGYREFRDGETNSWVFNAALYSLENYDFDLMMCTDFLLDGVQHKYGCHTPQAIEACKSLDGCMNVLLKKMKKDTNLIIVSDHGQTNTENMVNLEIAFKELKIDALNSDGGIAYIKFNKGVREERVKDVIGNLRGVHRVLDQNEAKNRKAFFTPYKVNDIWVYPADLMLEAKENWSFDYRGPLYWRKLCGDHGGLRDKEIHNTLIMYGPDFREEENVKGSVTITDVAPTIAEILGIPMETQGETLDEVLR